VVGLQEGQVHQVVKEEEERQCQHDESREIIFVVAGEVEPNAQPIEDSDREVCSLQDAQLQLPLELPKGRLLGALEGDGHEDGEDDGGDGCDGAEEIEGVLGGGVAEVESGCVCEVEFVEENESENDLLEHALADCVQAGCAPLEEVGGEVEDGGYEENGDDHHQHQVAVAQEVGTVVDRADSLGREALQQPVGDRVVPDVEVETVGGLEVLERGQHEVEVVHASQRQEGELQHSEEFETDYFTGEGREEECGE
jgi:hypothetical protein